MHHFYRCAQRTLTTVSTLIPGMNTPPFDSADATLRVSGQGKSQGKMPFVLSVATQRRSRRTGATHSFDLDTVLPGFIAGT
jgi:hypothetical protein